MLLSSCQRDMRPPVKMRQGTRAFSSVSRGDSDFPSSCEMKEEPAFKSLQENPALFRVRASRCPFHLRQPAQVPSNIPIAERSPLLRCLWKIGIPLESKPQENQLSSQHDLWYTELFSRDFSFSDFSWRGEVSWFFSSCGGNLGYILTL